MFRRRARTRFVEDYIQRHLKHGPMHFTLIDPDKQSPRDAGRIAQAAAKAGSHLILVGGSTAEDPKVVDRTVKLARRASGLPVVLFPGGSTQVSAHADAILFMMLLNSKARRFLIGEQVKGAPVIDRLGMEAIPMGYLVVEPGGTVGRVGEADLVRQDDVDGAIAYALAAQFLGMRFVYLEAGSGADRPVSPAMVRAVKRAVQVPVIVGGGLRSADAARDAIEAGADIIVTGTLVEAALDVEQTLGDYLFGVSERLKREIRRNLNAMEEDDEDATEPEEPAPRPKRRPLPADDEDEDARDAAPSKEAPA